MKPFSRLGAIAAPLPMANIDTDKILAGRFLKTISREGLGDKLFWSLRQNSDFALNRAPWNEAGIIVALDNFGCGSSREHAPWALLDFGVRCIIAPSIADIFYNNCFKNGILPITLAAAEINALMDVASVGATARMTVDLPAQTVTTADGRCFCFEVDPRRKQDLLTGLDDISRTTGFDPAIAAFEARHARRQPWIASIRMGEF